MEIMVAEAAVSFAVETLGKMLSEKAQFLTGVEEDVKWLQKELKSIQCFMKDAAKKQSDDESIQCFLKDAAKRQSDKAQIRNWISSIREVAHEAEDAIETFVLKVQSKSLKKKYGCFPNHLYHLNRVGEKIKSIRQKLNDIQVRRVNYNIQEDGPSTRTESQEEIEMRRRVAYWKPDQQVVGLEEDVKLLLREAVSKESEGLSVAAIVAMDGMGKSTLASKIYNHPAIAGGFEFRAWVVVSREFAPEGIMKQMLWKLGVSVDDKLSQQEELKKEVHKRLTSKRYFIVLDDVWEPPHWESLRSAFPDGDKGSRLLLTSRNQVITAYDGYVHNMKPLGDTESRDLFMKKAFGGNTSFDECPEQLKKVGEEILKKCGGLPLAISVVGGVLAKKTPSRSEWEKVHKEMKSHLERSKDLNNIPGILELSYQNLTPELKACFLCLAFFKEDATIKATKLVQIWVAHGLVPQEVKGEEARMEDVARGYLNELISRKMVQVKEMAYDVVKGCQVHDLLHDLSIRKAKEEIDFELLREESNSQIKCSLNKPRHRVMYYDQIRLVYSTNRNRHLRSLYINRNNEYLFTSGGPSLSYWKSFELLRFLDLGNAVFRVLPKGIGELTGLKYLRMMYCGRRSRLPRSWAKLKNLEVLDLRGSYYKGFITIDKVIQKMESLCHLYARVASFKAGSGNLRKLRTLHMFRPKNSSDAWKIKGLSGVSKLGIDLFNSHGPNSSLFTCLSSLPNLFHLTVGNSYWTDLEGLISLDRVTRLKLFNDEFRHHSMPAYFPPNLSHLTLSNIWLEEDSMPVLGKQPHLLYLKIKNSRMDSGITEITTGGFPKLKVLHLYSIDRQCKIDIEESAMPELEQFIIDCCTDVDVVNAPEHIKSVTVVIRASITMPTRTGLISTLIWKSKT